MGRLTVSKVAERVGTSPDTLRYYERIGLLPAPERTASGYRLYDEAAVDRVVFIKQAQRFGLHLDQIGELLQIRERGLCPCGHTRTLLEQRVAHLEAEMAAMGRLRDAIRDMLDDVPPGVPDEWQCSTRLLQIRPARSASSPTEGGDT